MRARAAAAFAVIATLGVAPQPDRAPAAARPLYDRDPHHLWNRLYDALFVRVGPDGREVADAVQRLRAPLATAIARLALPADRSLRLPDNSTDARRAGVVPSELFAPAGPWVSVGSGDEPVARVHAADAGPAKNSTFIVMVRLPAGRAATLAFLDRLRAFDAPLWVETADKDLKSFLPYYPHPGVPQFPAGTRVALVRRALLVDSTGNVVPSPLTESIQLRTYTRIDPMTPQAFLDAH